MTVATKFENGMPEAEWLILSAGNLAVVAAE
jgi:hypothetical protein